MGEKCKTAKFYHCFDKNNISNRPRAARPLPLFLETGEQVGRGCPNGALAHVVDWGHTWLSPAGPELKARTKIGEAAVTKAKAWPPGAS